MIRFVVYVAIWWSLVCSVRPEIKVALIGDSLFQSPVEDQNLIGKLISRLSDYRVIIRSFARESAKIEDIYNEQVERAINYKPDVVFLLWDSDCSDVDESKMSRMEVEVLRSEYREQLNNVIDHIKKSGIELAFGGPVILGEGEDKDSTGNNNKKKMLEAYRKINQEVAAKSDVHYIDFRKEFMKKIPKKYKKVGGILTRDGGNKNYTCCFHLKNNIKMKI